MDRLEVLKHAANDPRLPAAEREAARRVLREQSGAPAILPAEPELHLTGIATIAEPERELLRFAGAEKLAEVTPLGVIEFLKGQPQPLPEAVKTLVAIWSMFRGSGVRGGVTGEVWHDIKERFPESEWRSEFKRITAEHSYLAYNDSEHRRRFQFWASMCEHRDAYDVRVYLIHHVHEVLNGLAEFEFELRNEVQTFITDQEKRWKQEP